MKGTVNSFQRELTEEIELQLDDSNHLNTQFHAHYLVCHYSEKKYSEKKEESL